MDFMDLEKDGYKRCGNWFMKDEISINFMSETIKHTLGKIDLPFNRLKLTLEDVNNFKKSVNKILQAWEEK